MDVETAVTMLPSGTGDRWLAAIGTGAPTGDAFALWPSIAATVEGPGPGDDDDDEEGGGDVGNIDPDEDEGYDDDDDDEEPLQVRSRTSSASSLISVAF
jgi:hypothetical protein